MLAACAAGLHWEINVGRMGRGCIRVLTLTEGGVYFTAIELGSDPPEWDFEASRQTRFRWEWWPEFEFESVRSFVVFVPLWIPLVLVGLPTGWMLVRGRRDRRSRAGLCAACGYDLAGVSGVCPECGEAQAAQGAAS